MYDDNVKMDKEVKISKAVLSGAETNLRRLSIAYNS